MHASDKLIDELEKDKLKAAKQMSAGERLLAGPRLFDLACQFALADIRRKYSGADNQTLIAKLRERVRIALELEDSPWKPKLSRWRS